MRRKKLASKIVSILMAGLMMVSTPASALATDIQIQDDMQQVEVQTASEDEAASDTEGDLAEEATGEDSEDEDITLDEDVSLGEEEVYSDGEGEEVIIGDSEEDEDEIAPQAEEGETDPAATPAADADISVTISVKGDFAKAKNGSKMVQKDVTVKDLDGNGKLTVDEALTAAHDAYYDGGAASGYGTAVSEQYGAYISKLWGDESGAYGYLDNDVFCYSLDDEVKANDNLVAYVYKDATGYSDAYIRFGAKQYTTEEDSPIAVEIEKAGWDGTFTSLDGVQLTACDLSFQPVDQDIYTVDGYDVTFSKAGTYYLTASGTESLNVVPAVAKVTVAENSYVPEPEPSIPATDITVYSEEVSVFVGEEQKPLIFKTPSNSTDELVLKSEDESIATVETGNKVKGIAPGTTKIIATAGTISKEIPVTVKKLPVISNIALYKNKEDYQNGKESLKITPEFKGEQREGYTTEEIFPDYSNTLCAVVTMTQAEIDNMGYSNVGIMSNMGYYVSANLNNGVAVRDDVSFSDGTVKIYAGPKSNLYQINVKRYATLSDLKIDGEMDKDFDRDTTEYHASVDKNADGVTITPTGNNSAYTIKVNGKEVPSGESYTVPYDWDQNQKMKITVEVSGEGIEAHTYTVEAEPYAEGDIPRFVTQPKSAEYITGDTTEKLSFVATANGKMTYQWYRNTENNTNGSAIEGATEASYQPSSAEAGVTYYYCVVTNSEKEQNNTATSETACITVYPDPTPKVAVDNPGTKLSKEEYEYLADTGYVYAVEDTAIPITLTATSEAEGGTWDYQWISNTEAADLTGGVVAQGETVTSYTPNTTLVYTNNTGTFYRCKVTYTFKEKNYEAYSEPVYVFVKATEAIKPVIINQPVGAEYKEGDVANALTVGLQSNPSDKGTKTYQWYYNETDSTENGTAIGEATDNTYQPTTAGDEGTRYYYCVVTNTLQGFTTTVTSNTAKVVVTSIKGLVGEKLSGTGTQEDPYLIGTAEDYQSVAEFVSQGISFNGKYLKQTANITLPKSWNPIGVKSGSKLYAFSGYLDGNGKTVSVPAGGLPLLGYVKEAEVHNLKIYGKKIAGYGLVNNFEGIGLHGSAIVIDHVTLKSGSSTLKSGLIGANITTNSNAGCTADFVATIRNCTIEKGVVIGYNKDQTMIGSIAGRMQGYVENCVSYATVYGKDYVGGIIGTRDNALGDCIVRNCNFNGTVEASGTHAGGIAGGGYENSTAPNGIKISIDNCSVDATVTGADKVGGILGADSYVAQAWNAYSFKGNSFTGKVTATAGTYVGGIIGFYDSLNKYDAVANNFYSKDCGAEKAIGFVQYIDTNCVSHETTSGATYINTENSVENCPVVTGCSWRTQHNRTDDPLGADASTLANTDGVKVYVEKLEITGEYKTEYYMGQAFDLTGMTFTAAWSDGKVENPTVEDVQITGFDTNKKGWQTVTITYKEASATVRVKLLSSIKVTFSLLGDKKHDSDKDGEIHTLTDNNLTVWVPETNYYVNPDATVYDVMQEAAQDYGFEMIADDDNQYGTIYVKGIKMNGITLSEFDNGPKSGWMDVINGTHPEVGVAEQTLNNNDVIIFHYTDDYTKEEWKGEHVHSWDKGVVTKAPTCTATGIRTYTCEECGETMTEVIPAAGHKYGKWTTTSQATVFAQAVQTRICSVCKKKETKKVGSKLKPTMTVNMSTVPLKVKQKTSALRVTGLAKGDKVSSYKSSNTKIFTVSKSGVITAGKKSGKATLTITLASGLKKNITVKVQKSTVATTKITGLKSTATLKKGAKLTLTPSRTPLTSTQKFTYSSSNKKIATVNSKGVITAKKPGKTKITVKSGKKKFTVTVTVTK